MLLVGLVFAVVPVGSALAGTTVGQTGGAVSCIPGGGTVAGDVNYVVPSAGTITSFSFQSTPANAGDKIDFLVLRNTTFNDYTVVGKTGVVVLKGRGNEPETFPAIPPASVQGGDILGFWVAMPPNPPFFPNCVRIVGSGGVVTSGITPVDPNIGDSVVLTQGNVPLDLNESANLAQLSTGGPPPTSKDQCKHRVWKSFGTTFKNQGDCVSFVATDGGNQPSGTQTRHGRGPLQRRSH